MLWWRNRQTQRTQNPPGSLPCGFDSHPEHEAKTDGLVLTWKNTEFAPVSDGVSTSENRKWIDGSSSLSGGAN